MLGITFLCFIYREKLVLFYFDHIAKQEEVQAPIKNEYYRDYDYEFVQNTDNFNPKNKNDILNIYFTVLNSGVKNFYFYCPDKYDNCINDIKEITNNKTILSTINNYVHPYNSYKNIETSYYKTGKVEISIEKTYSENKINTINKQIDYIINEIIKDEKDTNTMIKLAHDYIVNNTKYDSNRSDKNISEYDSDTAYGALIEGYALCGGYTDSMAIILDRLNIKNFKIASDSHIWNAVNMNDEWYHLDLTWDDPVTSDNSDILEYNFFMIGTEELEQIKTNYHTYNKDYYKEL